MSSLTDEQIIRTEMEYLRPVTRGHIHCDMCGKPSNVQRHHIITRGETTGNYLAKELANGPLVTAMLCNTCHDEQHRHTEYARPALLQKLYVINGGDPYQGYIIMKNVFDQIRESGLRLHWTLPEPE